MAGNGEHERVGGGRQAMIESAEDMCAEVIAHDHIHGINDLQAVVFMNRRLGRNDIKLADPIYQTSLRRWEKVGNDN